MCLPEYTCPTSIPLSGPDSTDCPCRSTNSPTTAVPAPNLPSQPSPLHTHRPLHLMRQPSINPPSFYDDVAPPPLMTPPPNYDDLTPRIEVRDGYFDMDGTDSNSDESTEPVEEPASAPVEAELEEETEEEEDLEEEDIVH